MPWRFLALAVLRRAVLLVAILSLIAPLALWNAPRTDAATTRFLYFSITGHNVAHPFLEFFETRGGVDVFGYPRTEQFWEDGRLVQYFQRYRLEWHPENPPRYRVQLGLIGDEILGPADPPVVLAAGVGTPPRRYFPETGHTISHDFAAFFDKHGGIDIFGYPTSEPYWEGKLLVQRFQRAKMEYHADNPDPWKVLLALLGDMYIFQLGRVPLELTRPVPPLYSAGDRSEVLARRGTALVRAAPHTAAERITELYYDARLPALDRTTDREGNEWLLTRLWGSIDGWIRLSQVTSGHVSSAAVGPADRRRPPSWPVPSATIVRAQSTRPLAAWGRAPNEANVRASPSVFATLRGVLAPGQEFRVTGWQGDGAGGIWYQIDTGRLSGWLYAPLAELSLADPIAATRGGEPLWKPIAGKGMWTFYDVLVYSEPRYLMAAAQSLGLTHLYVEVPANASGVVERRGIDALLPAAHQAGVTVIGWVMPLFDDLHGDVLTAIAVAEYRTPSGHRFDGVALDIEERLDPGLVGAYVQTIRASVGDERLLVGVTYPPTSSFGPAYPYRTVARAVNAFAPMGYWHDERRTYPYAEVYDYTRDNILQLRQRTGRPDLPISFIGQAYDHFARNAIGPNNPTTEEIEAALQAARDFGAIGISFYQWPTATPEEWAAIRNFVW